MLRLESLGSQKAPLIWGSKGNKKARVSLSTSTSDFSIPIHTSSCLKPFLCYRWTRLQTGNSITYLNTNSLVKRLGWSIKEFKQACKRKKTEEVIEERLKLLSRMGRVVELFSTGEDALYSVADSLKMCEFSIGRHPSFKKKTEGFLLARKDQLIGVTASKGIYTIDVETELGSGVHKVVTVATRLFGFEDKQLAASMGKSQDGNTHLNKEVEILLKLPDSKGIIKTLEAIPLPKKTCIFFNIESGYLQLQKLYQNTLNNVDTYSFTLQQKHSILKQLLEGLTLLEVYKIQHRDIKPENILYRYQEDGTLEVVLADFSIATSPPYDRRPGGTAITLSPEMCRYIHYYRKGGEKVNSTFQTLTSRIDIWGLGVTLYPLFFSKEVPWLDSLITLKEIIATVGTLTPQIMKDSYGLSWVKKEEISTLEELVMWMCHPNYEERISASEALEKLECMGLT